MLFWPETPYLNQLLELAFNIVFKRVYLINICEMYTINIELCNEC